MLTKILPAGELDRYLESDHDSMGRPREFPAEKLRGCPTEVIPVLVAQAPWGVRPRPHQNQSKETGRGEPAVRKRPDSEWNRHCQRHLVHLISCFHERRAAVERNLTTIIQETEHLILAGLPANVLQFYWYEHPKTFGAHAHGGLLRTLLHSGRPYAPRLHPELRLGFDRLVSRHFGYRDPLDPAGHRLAYAAWGSAKPENAAEIQAVGELAGRWWASRPAGANAHPEFLAHLGAQFQILVQPAADGRVQLTAGPLPGRRVPQLPNTVVIASQDGRRAICFKGPACQFDFNPAVYAAGIAGQQYLVDELRQDGRAVYARFQKLLGDRVQLQQGLWVGPDAERVTQSDFAWLETKLAEAQSLPADRALQTTEELAAMDPLMRWTERGHPFATDREVMEVFGVDHRPVIPLPDETDWKTGTLRELVEEELELAALCELEPEVLEFEKPVPPRVVTPAPAAPIPPGSRRDPDPKSEPPVAISPASPPHRPATEANPAPTPQPTPPPAIPPLPIWTGPRPPSAEELERQRRRALALAAKVSIQVAGEWEQARSPRSPSFDLS